MVLSTIERNWSPKGGTVDDSWRQVVRLMRSDVAALADEPDQAWRFVLRMSITLDLLTAQLQRMLGMVPTEIRALLTLWDLGSMTVGELATQVRLSSAAITTLVDRLERRGLIEREEHPTDKRRVVLHVTKKAEQTLARTTALLQSQLTDTIHNDPDGWHRLVTESARLRDTIQDVTKQLQDTEFDEHGEPVAIAAPEKIVREDRW